MKMKKNFPAILAIMILVLLAVYFFSLYFIDQGEISKFVVKIASKNEIARMPEEINYMQVVRIRDSGVSEIDQNILALGKRIIWGHRVSQIIKKRAGHCGEVTRLLVNLFHRLRIPARRVTLFGRGMMHAVIEAKIGNKWFIIDTDNGPTGFREFVTATPASIEDHFPRSTSKMINTCVASQELQRFNIYTYSYFFNLNPIFLRFFNLQVLLLKPLPVWVYFLLENPPLLAAWTSLFCTLIPIVFLLVKKRKLKKQKNAID